MKAKNTTAPIMYAALKAVNIKYDNNIIFEHINCLNSAASRFSFRLKVKDSKKAGHRRGFTGRRLINACWHVHGDFFDALFKLSPDAEIRSNGFLITKESGNWQDINIGSMMQPLYFSEACDCN
ncbi:MAG: hypothetical protein ACYSSI_00160 [Planctomycetota bacterium]|jgi:hypothetical protein